MKKEYAAPEFSVVRFKMEDVMGAVVHTSFEQGGQNSGWTFNDDDDDIFGDD